MKTSTPVFSPMVEKMVPIRREAKRPKAMAPRASMKYVCTVKLICFLFRNSFQDSRCFGAVSMIQ